MSVILARNLLMGGKSWSISPKRMLCSSSEDAHFRARARIRINNVKKGLTVFALLGFVSFIYLTAITKMKQTDDLQDLIEKETMEMNRKK